VFASSKVTGSATWVDMGPNFKVEVDGYHYFSFYTPLHVHGNSCERFPSFPAPGARPVKAL
jgi:hypothetical protein